MLSCRAFAQGTSCFNECYSRELPSSIGIYIALVARIRMKIIRVALWLRGRQSHKKGITNEYSTREKTHDRRLWCPLVHKVGNLFYSDTTSEINSHGSMYVDVEETWQPKIAALKLHRRLSEEHGVARLDSIEHLIEREETNLKFRGFQVERNYCEIFQPALNYRVTWAHDLLPIATLPPLEE